MAASPDETVNQSMKRENKFLFRNISLQAFIFLFLFLAAIIVFTWLAHEVVGENEEGFDNRVFVFLKAHSSPATIGFFKFITFFGSTYFVIAAYMLLIGYLVHRHRNTDAIDIAIIAATSFALMGLLKQYFARHRPPLPLFTPLTNYSFPSGHAVGSFILCAVLIYLVRKSHLNKTWKWLLSGLFILLCVLVGISRIVLRYHYATDVIAGFCIAFAWLFFSLWLQRKFRKKTTVNSA